MTAAYSGDGWNHPASTLQITTTEDGRKKVFGHYSCRGSVLRYSLTEQKTGMAKMRGRISLLDHSGRVMQVAGEEYRRRSKRLRERKKERGEPAEIQGRPEELTAIRQIYLQSMEQEAIRAAITKAADALCADNAVAIIRDSGGIQMGQMHFRDAVVRYGSRFVEGLSPRGVRQETKHQKLRRLSLLAEQVSSYSMQNISKTVLRGLYRKEPEKMRVSFALAAKFYDWCREDGRYSGPNPFQEFLEEVPRKKTKTDALQRKAIELKSLPKKVETELNRLIEAASWTDLCVTGLLLIKEAGLTARDAGELRWKDVLLNELKDDWNLTKGETVQIAIRREGLSGATHNYTRPVSAFGARELSRRFQEAKQEYGEHVWEKRVLQAPGCTEIDKDRLTAYCRQALLHAGMKYEQLKKDPQKEHGVGIRLLLSNYHYRLSYHCGIQNPSVLCYLEGKRMSGDVTADHYRSLSAEEGQRYLQAALNRDKRFQTEGFRQIEETTQDHVTRTVISPPDSRHFTKSRVSVLLQPGDVLECLSPEGLRVNGKVRKEI